MQYSVLTNKCFRPEFLVSYGVNGEREPTDLMTAAVDVTANILDGKYRNNSEITDVDCSFWNETVSAYVDGYILHSCSKFV